MADGKRDKPDEIGTPDPDNEPTPPRINEAGELGAVGERKLEEGMDKKGIWGSRQPTDEDTKAPAAHTPTTPR